MPSPTRISFLSFSSLPMAVRTAAVAMSIPLVARISHGPRLRRPGARVQGINGVVHMARLKHLPKTLTREEASRLLSQPSRRYPTEIRNRALLRVFYRAGLRCSEALELRVQAPRSDRVHSGR